MSKPHKNGPKQDADAERKETNRVDLFLGKVDTFLDKISTWWGGLATVCIVAGWAWSHRAWMVLLTLPVLVFFFCRKLKIQLRWQVLVTFIATLVSVGCGVLFLSKHAAGNGLNSSVATERPHLKLSVYTGTEWEQSADLTNEVLIVTNADLFQTRAALCLPKTP